jgi:sugar (pentulose or hexulose) kinase
VLKHNEGAAFGAALQALAMLDGDTANLAALTRAHLEPDEARSCDPRPAAVHVYNQGYEAYRQAVTKVAALYRDAPTRQG